MRLAAELELSRRIARLDQVIRSQVQEILHHPRFQALEAAWRSLEYLVSDLSRGQIEDAATDAQAPLRRRSGAPVIVRVLSVSHEDLLQDFEDAIEFDQSALYHQVYEMEYGRLGGEPFAMLVADFSFGPASDDVEVLRGLSNVAAAAHAVCVAAAEPALMGKTSWDELSWGPSSAPDNPRYASLRRSDDTRYLALLLPRILLRSPYQRGDARHPLGLHEEAHRADQRLWGNPAFALAKRAMASFSESGWCTAVRGIEEERGLVPGLPEESFATDAPGRALRTPVEVAIHERQERALVDQGLAPICRVGRTHQVGFFSLPTLHEPHEVADPAARANLALSSQLPYILAASRFAHYLKCLMRDRIGAFTEPSVIQSELAAWLSQYTLLDERAGLDLKARHPLRDFEVAVRERPGRPGQLEAVVKLQPHYQVEDPNVVVRLSVDLPALISSAPPSAGPGTSAP